MQSANSPHEWCVRRPYYNNAAWPQSDPKEIWKQSRYESTESQKLTWGTTGSNTITFNERLICSLVIMSLLIDRASVCRSLMSRIICASAECRWANGGGYALLRLKTLACIWMQAGGDSEWNVSHYQPMLAVFLLTELFKCMVGIKFWHCNGAAWRRRSRGICVELPLKLIQNVLGNCCYRGGTFLEARRERANFLNVDS